MTASLLKLREDSQPAILPPLYSFSATVSGKLETEEEHYRAAWELVPFLRANAAKAHELRRLPDENVEALIRSGLVNTHRPALYGGPELDFHANMKIMRILAEGCSATAWVCGINSVNVLLLSMLPKVGQDEILGSGEPILAVGVLNSAGAKARRVPGGFMLSGKWMFASGAPHSNWACLSAVVADEEGSSPEAFTMVVPRSQYLANDDWYSLGMRGTGSGSVSIPEEIFVPEHRSLRLEDQLAGTTPGGRLHKAVSYRLTGAAAFIICVSAPSIGIAHEALRLYSENVKKRTRAFTAAQQSENSPAAIRMGAGAMDLHAAELVMDDAIREIEAAAAAGVTVTVELKSKVRMAAAYVTNTSKKVVTSVLEASSASAMGDGSPLAKALLDVTTISTHHILDYDGGPENYGRVLMGLGALNQLL